MKDFEIDNHYDSDWKKNSKHLTKVNFSLLIIPQSLLNNAFKVFKKFISEC